MTFDIWEKTNADGKTAAEYEFTSLLVSKKKSFCATCQTN
jgi:hypothetical protein